MFMTFQKKLIQWIGPLKIKAKHSNGNKYLPTLEIEQTWNYSNLQQPLLLKANLNGYIPSESSSIRFTVNGQNALSFYGNGECGLGRNRLFIGRNVIGIQNYCDNIFSIICGDTAASFETQGISLNRPFIAIGTPDSTTEHPRLYYGGYGILEQKHTSDVTQHYLLYARFVSATSYQRVAWRSVKETVTLTDSSVSTSTLVIPKFSQLLGVSTRINTAIGTTNGTTGYQIGDGVDTDLWGNVTGTAIGTTSDSRNFTALNALGPSSSDRTITITATGGDFDGTGVIDICAFYLRVEAD